MIELNESIYRKTACAAYGKTRSTLIRTNTRFGAICVHMECTFASIMVPGNKNASGYSPLALRSVPRLADD